MQKLQLPKRKKKTKKRSMGGSAVGIALRRAANEGKDVAMWQEYPAVTLTSETIWILS